MAEKRPTVVIVGAGFTGTHAAEALLEAPVKVVMMDRNNHHLVQPLLRQAAAAALMPGEIACPVRTDFREQKNFEFRLAEMLNVDLDRRVVYTSNGTLFYDWLILAVGGESNYFGLDSLVRNGFDVKGWKMP
ncbi:MAG TPA: FAD-dependent oxidoreductase, partial [Anaerolineales bacterium]|jgi:NADH dehydrogenase|nr:FAD-dependent oxidoreductase [Anaerolineales bacterium]